MNRNDILELFRAEVLLALDKAANQTFKPPRNDSGASGRDLRRLFSAIDFQVGVLAERYGVTLEDD